MKKICSTTFYSYIFIILFPICTANLCFGQGAPWGDEKLLIDESDFSGTSLNADIKFSNSNSIFKEEPDIIGNRMDITANTGGYFGLNIVKPEDRQMNDVPGLPCGPDVACPINTEIIYLIFAGLLYGVIKCRKSYQFKLASF